MHQSPDADPSLTRCLYRHKFQCWARAGRDFCGDRDFQRKLLLHGSNSGRPNVGAASYRDHGTTCLRLSGTNFDTAGGFASACGFAFSSVRSRSARATSHNDVAHISAGSTFSITEIKTAETPDPDAETKLTLQIGIKKQPEATVDHTKVKIQVFFYDTVDNKDIKLTDADV